MNSLYRKLAFTNMKNNRQFYLPYLLTGMLSVMMFYSMRAMQGNSGLDNVRGSADLKMILSLGLVVIGIFVCILLFYTNSFIMKRRKKELGVYNILGMEKKHIARVLFWETLTTFVLSVGGGLVFGIAFNKMLTMLLYRMTGLSESIPFYISGWGCAQTVELFGLIYLATLFYNFMQVKLANPMELLRSGNTGEREPKTKLLLAILGVICLAAGYYIAITTEDIMGVLSLFFVAVLLVIVGTYALFIAGSIAFLKLLRSNKNYYYQTKHFTTVSGMIYRMKQNAVGLANICILSTMVLVMVSTTVSMYVGVGDSIEMNYAGDVVVSLNYHGVPDEKTRSAALDEVKGSIRESGRVITNIKGTASISTAVVREGNELSIVRDEMLQSSEIGMAAILTKADYEALEETTLQEFGEDEIVVAASPVYGEDSLVFLGTEYRVAENRKLANADAMYSSLLPGGVIYLVVSDDEALAVLYEKMAAFYEKNPEEGSCSVAYEMAVDMDGTAEEKKDCAWNIRERMSSLTDSGAAGFLNVSGYGVRSKQEGYEDYMTLNGSFFFLGLFLGLMFLLVTVLIMYYKQISEGYEDKERFAIMEKVGMSSKEVKAAIGSQVRTVFFLPIVMAAIHLAAAFPMLSRLLAMLSLYNKSLFALCLLATLLVFGVIYFIVFKVTSKTYYRIVGEQF